MPGHPGFRQDPRMATTRIPPAQTSRHAPRPRRRGRCLSGLALLLLAAPVLLIATSCTLVDLSDCSEASLRAALATDPVVIVSYTTDCPDLLLGAPLTAPAGTSVTIDAKGHTVVLDGQGATRLFEVTGGSLIL